MHGVNGQYLNGMTIAASTQLLNFSKKQPVGDFSIVAKSASLVLVVMG